MPRAPGPRGMKKGPGGPSAERYGERERKGAPRRGSPAAPPRPSPPDAGRAPSTGQRRPALPRADPAVPSALGGLASGFGMGPGVPRPPWPLTGGRRSSLDDEIASHAGGEPLRVPWGPHSELNGPCIPLRPQVSRTRQAHGTAPAGMRRVRARAISAARLRLSPALHLRPINQVVYLGPYRKEN